jgi:sulfatase maturation enzyme AslB (radical SAM superfamily)
MVLVFHGGETMLMGTERFRRFTNRAREKLGEKLKSLQLQSNATLVDDDWITTLRELGVTVGVSMMVRPNT